MKVDRKEMLRYLGYKNQNMDSSMQALIDQTVQELEEKINPKSVYRIFPCTVSENDLVTIENLSIQSKHLSKNLRGCNEVVLFTATLGPSIDHMIKRATVTNLAKAAILQAAGAALIETYCDELEEEVRLLAQDRNLYLRPRYSPGYGDVPLIYQKDIFAMLECSKRIGVSLTDTFLMVPSKSVSAFIGLCSIENKNCHKNKCAGCTNETCEYRNN